MVDSNARGIAPSHVCPNCRGPPTMIAIWLYIGTDRVTQEHQGLTARNEIEGNAQRFPLAQNDMSTPATPRSAEYELQRQTTPSSARELIAQAFSPRNSPRDSPRQIFPTFTGVFHSQTRLPDGRPSVIIDPGSVQNLCGDKWAKLVAMAAARAGAKPTHKKRAKPLDVSGVGNGSQACHFDCSLPVAFRSQSGSRVTGMMNTPAVAQSDLPGLLGLDALRKNRAVLDFESLRLHFCGPGDINVERNLPPGTDTFQLEVAPSGHIVLPCCEYAPREEGRPDAQPLTLLSRVPSPPTHAPILPVTVQSAHNEPRCPAPSDLPESRL